METQFLQRSGGRIAYDDSGGPGPLVLCAPGMGDVRGVYRFLTPKLVAAGYRVVTMDIRGHGESSPAWSDYSPRAVGDDIVALLRHLDTGRAVVVGTSFTPASAIWVAAEAPDLVAGIVLCAPFASDPKPNPVVKAMSRLVGRFPGFWVRFYRSLNKTPPADLPAYLDALRRNLAEPGRMAALRAMMWAPKAECNDRIGEVACPVLVVMGTKDPDFPDPAAEARLIADRAVDAAVVMIEGAGHYPPAEFPDQTATALLEFLARVAASGDAD